MRTFAPCVVAYCLVAHFAFGDVFAGTAFWIFWSERLGAPWWPYLVGFSALLSAVVFVSPLRRLIAEPDRPAIFIASTMLLSLLTVGVYADGLRKEGIAAFKPDAYIQHSFFRSIRESPREFQDFLHVKALKDCVPYAWSYREMDFYRIPSAAAVNVIPPRWIAMCHITSEDDRLKGTGQIPDSLP